MNPNLVFKSVYTPLLKYSKVVRQWTSLFIKLPKRLPVYRAQRYTYILQMVIFAEKSHAVIPAGTRVSSAMDGNLPVAPALDSGSMPNCTFTSLCLDSGIHAGMTRLFVSHKIRKLDRAKHNPLKSDAYWDVGIRAMQERRITVCREGG